MSQSFKSFRSVAILYVLTVFLSGPSTGQNTLPAGPEYDRSGFHNFFFGKHYRKEWATPVTVPGFYLDTAGLTPYQAGGGRQSKTLRLHDKNGKEYVMRSLDKSFGNALPPIFQHTFVESVIDDQVSLGHPYASVSIPVMAEAAGIYHTNPIIVFIPKQPALDTFNTEYGDRMYMIEQRPDENWEGAANFGNSKKIVGTDKMLEKIREDNDNRPDQLFFIRARIFDMLIGDGSRHEDQWRWATFTDGEKTIYKAIPRDRDQAYGKFDGVLIKTFLAMADFQHLQSFRYKIYDVRLNNYPARNLDRAVANETTLQQWTDIAIDIQKKMTDEVIERSIRQLPPEVFPISGEELVNKLKARRDKLPEYAKLYYLSLAKHVEVVGSKKNEFFHITRYTDEKIKIEVNKIDKNGTVSALPFYSRTFFPKETKEVRLYGLEGNDRYLVDGEGHETIKVLIIGGTDRDSISDISSMKGGKKNTVVYDDQNNMIISSPEMKLRLSSDTSIHTYKYASFKYNDEGFKPVLLYSFEDKLYVGLAYHVIRHGWRKEPFKAHHVFQTNYSISQKNFSFSYKGALMQVIGKWGLDMSANYDLMRWFNYYGLGNNTKEDNDSLTYYRVESRNLLAFIMLNRPIGKYLSVGFGPVYNMVDVIPVANRYLASIIPPSSKEYGSKQFAGGQAFLSFSHLDDPAVPTKGFGFLATAQHMVNLEETDRQFSRYGLDMQIYLPIFKSLSLVIRPAAAAVTGDPEFYQNVSLGGSRNLRGYARDRFWGSSSFYSANELQYLFNVRSHLFNGKAGLVGFYDAGRVWLKNEHSDQWHTGYGAGILLAPFNKILASITYGMSNEGSHIHVMVARNF